MLRWLVSFSVRREQSGGVEYNVQSAEVEAVTPASAVVRARESIESMGWTCAHPLAFDLVPDAAPLPLYP